MSLQNALSWHVLAIYVSVCLGKCYFNAFYFYFISDSALPACVLMHHTYALRGESRRRCQILWDCIIDGSESPFVCCKSNPGPREEKPVLLTTEPALVV